MVYCRVNKTTTNFSFIYHLLNNYKNSPANKSPKTPDDALKTALTDYFQHSLNEKNTGFVMLQNIFIHEP